MNNINITAKKSKTGKDYVIPICLNKKNTFSIKFDPGANYTVISIDCLMDKSNKQEKNQLIQKIKNSGITPNNFISASGDTFEGYPVHAKNITIGKELFTDFHYYLVPSNKRIIALLGEDFLDNCDYDHPMHSDIRITSFDPYSYTLNKENAINNEDILTYIDEIAHNRNATESKSNKDSISKAMQDGLDSIVNYSDIK